MDQVINFRTDTNSVTPAAAAAAVALQKVKTEQDQLNAAFGRGAVGLGAYKAQLAALDKEAVKAQRALDKLTPEAAGGGGGGGKKGRAGNALLILGQGVQDFEAAGMRGVTNQIDQLAQVLGVGAGLAGALTIAGVAIQVFLPHIQAFLAQFQGENLMKFAGHLEGITARIEALKKTAAEGGGTAADILELRSKEGQAKRLTEGGRTFAELRGAKTEEEQAIEKEIKSQFVGDRGRKALDELVRRQANKPGGSITSQGLTADIEAIDKRIADAEKGMKAPQMGRPGSAGAITSALAFIGGLKKQRAEMSDKLKAVGLMEEDTALQDVGATITESTTDPLKHRSLVNDIEAAGFPDIAAKVAMAPRKVKDEAQLKKDQAAYDEEEKKAKVVWEKMEAERKHKEQMEGDALRMEGKLGEEQYDNFVKAKRWLDDFVGESTEKHDKRMAGFDLEDDKEATRQAEMMAKAQMKELRDPRIYGGMEEFLSGVQTAGVAKDDNRDLFEQMVTTLKDSLKELRNNGGVGP